MSYEAVMRLSRDPKVTTNYGRSRRLDWLEIAVACYLEAEEQKGESFDGQLVGKRVKWFPGLQKLQRYGILRRDDYLSGKRGAWWTIPDPEGVGRALRELGYLPQDS